MANENELQEYQGQILGTTADNKVLRVRVNDDGELVINLEASTLNIGKVDVATSALPTGASTEAKQDALNAIIGEKQTSPTANTLLARLKSLEDKIDAITGGTTPAVTKLSGSSIPNDQPVPTSIVGSLASNGVIPEYGWVDGDTEPVPTEFAFGAKVDATTNVITSMYWNGTAWVEVV